MKNKLSNFKYLFIVTVVILGSFLNVVSTPLQTTKVAEAQNGTSCGSYGIIAGTTDYISAEIMGDFGANCKAGVITGTIPGVIFDSQYQGQYGCSNGEIVTEYVTQNYDATAFPTNISLPTTYSVYVEANFDSGGECEIYSAYVEITVVAGTPPPPDFSVTCSPSTQYITAGNTTSYSIATVDSNGFNSAVTFDHSISGSGTKPTVSSYSNNGATPSAVTTATVATNSATSPGTYTITFTGTGGGQTHSCSSQVQVSAPPPGFTLSITPASNAVVKGTNSAFTVTANCTGSFVGPVTNLAASSFYTNVTYTFSAASIPCGQSVTLTVGSTGSVPANQLSTPQSATAQTITVTGEGN